jgi:hypothetical protein
MTVRRVSAFHERLPGSSAIANNSVNYAIAAAAFPSTTGTSTSDSNVPMRTGLPCPACIENNAMIKTLADACMEKDAMIKTLADAVVALARNHNKMADSNSKIVLHAVHMVASANVRLSDLHVPHIDSFLGLGLSGAEPKPYASKQESEDSG